MHTLYSSYHCSFITGTFVDGLNVTGWGILNIKTSRDLSDSSQHFAAGVVEGALTAHHIYTNYLNNMDMTFGTDTVPKEVEDFFHSQDAWARIEADANKNTTFWQHVGAIFAQFDGLVAGYKHAAADSNVPELPIVAFQVLNGIGDLFQIIPAVMKHKRIDYNNMTRPEIREALVEAGHCSALIKVLGALEDLLMAHSSWFDYAATNRIFKYYEFAFQATTGANKISFSSYAGYLESLDDFYMMDSGLGMIQTSNGVMNHSLYDLITPKSLLAWQRVRAASAIASTGEEWYNAFKTHASGTYVNQYMVVNFNLFTPGSPLQPGTLWVVEEIPGLVEGGDQTATLARGYWPSYNVPFYAEVYKRSGYPEYLDGPNVAGPFYNGGGAEYEIGAPRAKFFRRDVGQVRDMTSYKEFMRYANYSDPYAISNGAVDYGAAICMRGDLGHNNTGGAGGCYDSKVTSYANGFQHLCCDAVNGPSSTASSATSTNLPFSWRADVDKDTSHVGLPETYNFPFLRICPERL